MLDTLEEIKRNLQKEIKGISTLKGAEQLKIKYLGRNGGINDLMKLIPTLPVEKRAAFGQKINALKVEITDTIEGFIKKLSSEAIPKIKSEIFDITLPGKRPSIGKRHPLTQTIDDIKEVFARLGFDVAYGPEVELEHYNFEALNIPPDHPSRTDFDTFYIRDDVLLRSQTSTVQIRIMEKQKPPIRIIAPGRVYRPDTVDARHSFMFHQVEGLLVDEGVSFADLKGVLNQFIKTYFGQNIQVRFRPSFFPFTEPSAEIDISCSLCGGKGCNVCSYSGWVEILGAGMVDPNVFKAVHYDIEKYTGFAFGMGVERITMLKYGICDIRLFYENDIRFLSQF
ncbi:MAG: phenylalanine--tRNA ligase subunit alpha [Candidatus Brocadia sp. AMX2]|uniref:Phenylalanine--tRNA ligase alpha subunit n=1 Tax=Candidatus Brocadia sinica JPN1 TaxID=1197129 RepID=A0ABQ0JSH2_9BACT|nr:MULTISPECIES: phenylalanine--tRNA ligase subunit alpha [Brocadia]KXK28170.1 MAG: phenylalanyl-tRNA synthase alpha subunit [Candidatus Brocadia sinica]MBC6931320.1 phenylalanine--tRNA ligase subunit alpha [Candidatus Brocadia sp.]MBL1168667.1 phenylalanine--tRNA ligase subunit alpha [Candidatus Brocadia sp. AMX1]NOG43267.1 phenylalanine--tRNA ligase subunit alpha [Planctomycetota bacterium]KAA0245942.1 MAG: phenylalanine--tRNA ligase subunit alpha [Candidatus Brocadia sp. AMX2]